MRTTALLVSVVAAAGCTPSTVCDDGTIEIDGVCKPIEGPRDGTGCGPGTHFDVLLGLCVPDLPPTECDEGTTESYVDEHGVTICIGTAPLDCAIPPACPSPAPNKVTMCGPILDLETGERIEVAGATGGTPCDPSDPDPQGPCALTLDFYDALTFASNPNTPPLAVDQITVDECGYYKAINVPHPFTDAIGIAVRGPDHVTTGVAMNAQAGERVPSFNAYSTHTSTDQMWTDTGMPPFAPTTFGEHGVFVALYLPPTEGVRVTAGGATRSDSDYYFSDPDLRLTTVDPGMNATGPNGAALFINSSLTDHGGTGGEPAGCSWDTALATTITGVVFVQEKPLVDGSGNPCEVP